MEPLRTYAEHWFQHTAVSIGTKFLFQASRKRIEDIEAARPGFAQHLRAVALGHLSGNDATTVRRALAALAIVGTIDDIQQINALTESSDPMISGAARFARFELEHRAA